MNNSRLFSFSLSGTAIAKLPVERKTTSGCARLTENVPNQAGEIQKVQYG